MLKVIFRYLFILSVVTGVYSCSRPPQELKTAEQLIENHPDSALHILRNISPANYKSGESRALYGLLMIRTLDKKLLPLKPDSLLDYSIAYYEKNPDSDRLATCYLYKGRTYKYYFRYEKAVNYYLKALDEAKSTKDYLLSGRINSDLGEIYTIQRDYPQSRKKFYNAYSFFLKAHFQELAFHSLLFIGETYHYSQDYKTARKYFKQIANQVKDSLQEGALYQDMGLNFYYSNQYDSAYIYFKKIIDYPYVKNNKALRYLYLSNIYFGFNKFDSAYISAIQSINFQADIRTRRECYRVLTNSEFRRGHLKEMSFYMNKYVQVSDSIREIDAQIKGSYMETTYNAKKEAKDNKVQKWISWGALFLAILAFLLLLKRIYIKVRKEKKKILETYTEEKVGIHKKVIEDKRAVLQKQLEARKKSMLIEFKNAGAQERELQLKEIYKELLHFDEPELFFNEMNKFLNRLVTKLKKRYPTLNEKELMLCCYLLLHIPTYDMLILFGYKSDNSLKSLKKRLPKKLNLENATQLEDFLLSILSVN
jgi:tetratricopeptide (TPR) repeat protein